MNRYFIHLAYNGTNYHGWQIQNNAPTVQEKLNQVLSKLLPETINVTGCGRTDTGVHARNFYAHFDTEVVLDGHDFRYKLNNMLPFDIAIAAVFPVSKEAHARFDATSRTYRYLITQQKDPFLIDQAYYLRMDLNVEAMNEAAEALLQYTDFTAFSKTGTQVKTNHCKIKAANWEKKSGNLLTFTITADRFLRNMVRAVVGTLLEVGKNKKNTADFKRVIESKKRAEAGVSAPACGLYLTDITYPEQILKAEEKWQ